MRRITTRLSGVVSTSPETGVRATHPDGLDGVHEPVGRGNNLCLKMMARRCAKVVYAWGDHGQYMGRGCQVVDMLGPGWCFGINKTGEPRHPLYLPRNAQLIRYPATKAGDTNQ